MADNLYSNLLALPSPRAPMTATELGNFLAKDIRPLVSVNAKGGKDYLNGMINKLQEMQSSSIEAEQKAYNMLGVNSLSELQNELDKLNDAGLFSLSNEVLRTMPAVAKAKTAQVRQSFIKERIVEDFIEYMDNGEGRRSIEQLAQDTSIDLVAKFHDFEKTHLNVKKGSILKGISKRTTKNRKVLGLEFERFSKYRKKELQNVLDIKSDVMSVRGDGFEEILTITTKKQDVRLNYYPYFGLTEDERKGAMNDDATWERFVDAVASCVGGELQPSVKATMKHLMGRKAFIDTGGSDNDIVGILGELQSLVFLGYLGAKKSLAPRFLGHMTNEKEEKIGIDVALENIGFQIKNYKVYGSREQKDEGINLNGEYKLNNFLDLIAGGLPEPGMRWNLEQFYAASAYHIQMHADFGNIRTWMDTIQKAQLPKLYHGAIGELLPLKQITWVEEDISGNKLKSSSTNAFYIIGGKRILPVSKILSLYIKFLINLKKGIDSPKLIEMRSDDGVTYSGDETYANYYNDTGDYRFSGYHNIADKIKMHYRINMNIDYSIDEVLSRVINEGVEL